MFNMPVLERTRIKEITQVKQLLYYCSPLQVQAVCSLGLFESLRRHGFTMFSAAESEDDLFPKQVQPREKGKTFENKSQAQLQMACKC